MAGLFQVTLTGNHFGQMIQNVLHFTEEDPPDALPLENLANAAETFINIIRPAINQQVIYTKISVDDLTNGPAGAFIQRNINLAGSGGSDSASQLNACWVLKKETGFHGKRNIGRIYIPGMSPGFTSNGIINTSGINQWTTPLQQLNDNFTTSGLIQRNWTMVVWGRDQAATAFVPVRKLGLRTTPGSMRRRMVGVGV